MLDAETAYSVALASLREILDQSGVQLSEDLGNDTVIVGPGAVLDSIGVVSLIVEVEQRLEVDHGISVTLANDRAMSQRNSPFRTLGTLVEHIGATIQEGQVA